MSAGLGPSSVCVRHVEEINKGDEKRIEKRKRNWIRKAFLFYFLKLDFFFFLASSTNRENWTQMNTKWPPTSFSLHSKHLLKAQEQKRKSACSAHSLKNYTPPPRTKTLPRSQAARELYFSANSDILIVNRREVSFLPSLCHGLDICVLCAFCLACGCLLIQPFCFVNVAARLFSFLSLNLREKRCLHISAGCFVQTRVWLRKQKPCVLNLDE